MYCSFFQTLVDLCSRGSNFLYQDFTKLYLL